MRMFRALTAAAVTAVVTLGLGVATPAATAETKPKRTITQETPKPVALRAFQIKGQVTQVLEDGVTFENYVGKVKVQKKDCGKCKWKNVKTIKTNDRGIYKVRVFAPRTGRWKWRVRVPGSDGYAATNGRAAWLYVT